MRRTILTSLAVLLAWGASVNFASAQFGSLGQPPIRPRPTVSPFINSGGGALSYYGLIRPQTDTTKSIMELQNVVTRMNPDGSLQGQLDLLNPTMGQTGLETGHPASFMNYGRYYPNTPPMGSGSGIGGSPGFGTGLGGANPFFGGGIGNTGAGNRTFFGPTFNQFGR